MIAILLAAGFGTRLRPLTDSTPKALVDVAGRPLVDYLMDQLAGWPQQGLPLEAVDVVVNARFADAFADWQARWAETLSSRGVDLHLHNDGVKAPDERRGAVGDLQFVLDRVAARRGAVPDAIVSGTDSIYRVALAPFARRFAAGDASLLFGFSPREPEALIGQSVLALRDAPSPAALRPVGGAMSIADAPLVDVEGIVDAPDASPSPWMGPSFYGLKAAALRRVSDYLDAGGDPDRLGGLTNYLASEVPLKALLYDRWRAPRFHVNTPGQHRRARAVLTAEPVLLADARDSDAGGSDAGG
jgi:hypothetical protein